MRFNLSFIIVALLLTGCVIPGEISPETIRFSERCVTCRNKASKEPGICFIHHWVYYTETDSSQVLNEVVPKPDEYRYNESWLVARSYKHYYIVRLHNDSLARYSYGNFDRFKKAFSGFSIPDSLMID
jgi:hypothetical protein